jgi:hypothetical protein
MNNLPCGSTFFLKERISASALRTTLLKVARFLQNRVNSGTLVQYHDWWQHDGLHFEKGQTDIHSLFRILDSNRSLFEAMPGDQGVRIGISDLEQQWYLRYYLDWDEEGNDFEGDFHFSVPESWCKDVRAILNLAEIDEKDSEEVNGLLQN